MNEQGGSIHWNIEFIRGFAEAVLEEADWGLGVFKSDLANYGIDFKKTPCEGGDYTISIPFQIIGDRRADLFAWILIRDTASIVELKAKLEVLAEEIYNTVQSFKKGWAQQPKNEEI